MLNYLSPIGSAVAFSLVFTAPALAAQATTADLSGKKFCWDNELISTYFPGENTTAHMQETALGAPPLSGLRYMLNIGADFSTPIRNQTEHSIAALSMQAANIANRPS